MVLGKCVFNEYKCFFFLLKTIRKLVLKIEIFSSDLILDSFRISDYGLKVGSFTYSGVSEDSIFNVSTIEEYIGHNPKPIYLGQKYTDKLKPQITLIKNPHVHNYNNLYFSEKDCRWILRILTGFNGYQWLKLTVQEPDEELWYKAKIVNISYKRIGGFITGIILNMECDSCFAWSKEYNITINAKANRHFYIFNNTDDLNNYVYPTVSITSSSTGTLSICNLSDNWTSEIRNIKPNECITINSQYQTIISSTSHDLLLNDFNLRWFRLVPDKNKYISNFDITISMKFRVPRKVGIS